MEEGDDILSQALQEAEIKLEDDFEKSQLTQQKYIVETEPVTDSDSGLDALLDIVAHNDITDSQCYAIEDAVDISNMGGPHGPSEVGAHAIWQKPGETRSVLNTKDTSTDCTTEKEPERRFIQVSDAMITDHGKAFVPPNTLRKNKWSLNVFSKWRQEFLADAMNSKGECGEAYNIVKDNQREIHKMSDNELTTVLCIFIIALKKENGDHYPGYFTNHSLRASIATRLYNAGMGDQIVKEQTGHRSLAVENYKRTSGTQKRQA